MNLDAAAAEIVASLGENVKLNILAQGGVTLENSDVEGGDFTDEELRILESLVYDILKKDAPRTCYIELDDWWPLTQCYAVFGDCENEDKLWDNLEAFDVSLGWLTRIERRAWELQDSKPYGFMFLHVPRWEKDKVKAALENYWRRMNWEDKKYEDLAIEVLAAMQYEEKK